MINTIPGNDKNRWTFIQDTLVPQKDLIDTVDLRDNIIASYPFHDARQLFISVMLAYEALFNPLLQKQIFTTRYEFDPNPLSNTDSFRTQLYFCNCTNTAKHILETRGYIAVPALTHTLEHAISAFYKETKLIVFISDELYWKELFKLLAFRYALIEQYYTSKGETLIFDFKSLYKALVDEDVSTANLLITELFDKKHIKHLRYTKLTSYFRPNKERQLEKLEEKINYYRSKIAKLLEDYASFETSLKEKLETYDLISKQPVDDTSQECINYLLKHPYITNIEKAGSNALLIYFHSPILYYDETCLDKFINNSLDPIRTKLYKILKEKKYTLYTRCCLKFNTRTFETRAYTLGNSSTLIRHPHIDAYNCLGNHPGEIKAWIETGDYIGALDQLTAATLNLNLYDGIVISSLVENLRSNSKIPTFKDTTTEKYISFKNTQI